MSHFAKIENNLVTQVIVAEQSFVDTLEGEWIQTSYNTYGGVHYGNDGLPDSGTPLRKNYAGVGYHYDRVNDAFYSPKPNNVYELDTTTFLWKIKAEYTPLVLTAAQLSVPTLPVWPAGQPFVMGNITIQDGMYVFFPDLTIESGVYKYNIDTGLFTRVPYTEFDTVIVGGDYSVVYKYINLDWVGTAVPSPVPSPAPGP